MPKLDAALIDALGGPMPELEQLSAANQKKLAADLAAAKQQQNDQQHHKPMPDAEAAHVTSLN